MGKAKAQKQAEAVTLPQEGSRWEAADPRRAGCVVAVVGPGRSANTVLVRNEATGRQTVVHGSAFHAGTRRRGFRPAPPKPVADPAPTPEEPTPAPAASSPEPAPSASDVAWTAATHAGDYRDAPDGDEEP